MTQDELLEAIHNALAAGSTPDTGVTEEEAVAIQQFVESEAAEDD